MGEVQVFKVKVFVVVVYGPTEGKLKKGRGSETT